MEVCPTARTRQIEIVRNTAGENILQQRDLALYEILSTVTTLKKLT